MHAAQQAFAFVTDIHGNQTALEAVLNDIGEFSQQRGFENPTIVCLGDSFDGGPDPLAVFATLQSLSVPHLRGNHEDYLIDCRNNPDHEKFRRPLWRFVPWTVRQLGERLNSVEKESVVGWSAADAPLHAVHGALQGNNRVPDFFSQQGGVPDSFAEEFLEQIPFGRRFYFNGHSHYLGRHCDPSGRSVWFNCGSVGYPFVEKLPEFPDAPLATWVWVEFSPHMPLCVINRRVPYSSDELLRRYIDSGALAECAPFSFAIAGQSLFNQDIVYPFFQSVKKRELSAAETAAALMLELGRQNIFERLNRLVRKAGLREVSPVW